MYLRDLCQTNRCRRRRVARVGEVSGVTAGRRQELSTLYLPLPEDVLVTGAIEDSEKN